MSDPVVHPDLQKLASQLQRARRDDDLGLSVVYFTVQKLIGEIAFLKDRVASLELWAGSGFSK